MIRKTIIYAADHSYREPLETSIKSLAYNNHDVKIYVINNDIPQEWFIHLNRYLNHINCSVIDKKINVNSFSNLATPAAYLSYMTYGRLLIPKLISEDKIVYLDCDTIVNGSLDKLFNTDLDNHLIGAVRDCVIDGFNAGVMLINNKMLKNNPNITHNIFKAGTNQNNSQADQSALNNILGKNYLSLSDKYNYMVGSESDLFYNQQLAGDYFERLANCSDPIIIHYTSANKPWKETSSGRMRKLWWEYNDLEWSDVVTNEQLPSVYKQSKGKLFIFTQGEKLQNIHTIVSALPDFDFYIGAWTAMGTKLLELLSTPNVHLYPTISGPMMKLLSEQQVCYLDIAFDKDEQATNLAIKNHKPILTFKSSSTATNYADYHVFPDEEIEKMTNMVRQYAIKERN